MHYDVVAFLILFHSLWELLLISARIRRPAGVPHPICIYRRFKPRIVQPRSPGDRPAYEDRALAAC